MPTEKPIVLVADDDPDILSLVTMRLSAKGFEVLQASDGAETMRLARERTPDVVVLDVMMPQMSGWEVARALRNDPALKAVGIVILSAIGEKVNEMTSPLYGVDEFIDKPFDFSALEGKIVRALEARRRRA